MDFIDEEVYEDGEEAFKEAQNLFKGLKLKILNGDSENIEQLIEEYLIQLIQYSSKKENKIIKKYLYDKIKEKFNNNQKF